MVGTINVTLFVLKSLIDMLLVILTKGLPTTSIEVVNFPDVVYVIVIVDKDVQISSQFVYFNTSMVEMFTFQCDIVRNKLAIAIFDLKN
jgi:hypothetical protein